MHVFNKTYVLGRTRLPGGKGWGGVGEGYYVPPPCSSILVVVVLVIVVVGSSVRWWGLHALRLIASPDF